MLGLQLHHPSHIPEHNLIMVVLNGQELKLLVCRHLAQSVCIHYQVISYHILNHTQVNAFDRGPMAFPHVGHTHYFVGLFIYGLLLMEIHFLREGRYILHRFSIDYILFPKREITFKEWKWMCWSYLMMRGCSLSPKINSLAFHYFILLISRCRLSSVHLFLLISTFSL